jgi:hypothetical protein
VVKRGELHGDFVVGKTCQSFEKKPVEKTGGISFQPSIQFQAHGVKVEGDGLGLVELRWSTPLCEA